MKKDLFIIFFSILIAMVLAKTGALRAFLEEVRDFEILASFVSGFFFTSIFTISPAIVAIAELSKMEPLWRLALFGGLGAVIGDMVIFLFVRERLSKDISAVLGKIVGRAKYRMLLKILNFKPLRWINPILGALIIASPFPDEIGLALMSFSKVRPAIVAPLTFVFNALGILAIGLVAQSL
ncbi:MAG: hypothetical protein AAB944_00530 [Patescibacteria group bacterium]